MQIAFGTYYDHNCCRANSQVHIEGGVCVKVAGRNRIIVGTTLVVVLALCLSTCDIPRLQFNYGID